MYLPRGPARESHMDARAVGFFFLRGALIAAKFVVITLLLCLSALVPIAGWHRLALRVGGWWIWPAIAALTLVAFNIVLAFKSQVMGWHLLAVAPYAALMVIDSWLVLPLCIEHTRHQVDRYLSKEVAA